VTWYCKSMPSTWAYSPRRLAAPQHLSIAEPSRPEHAGRPHIPSRLLKPASAAQCLAQGPRRPHRRKGVPGRLPLGHTAPRSGIPCVARAAPHQGGVCALGPDGMGQTLCGAKRTRRDAPTPASTAGLVECQGRRCHTSVPCSIQPLIELRRGLSAARTRMWAPCT